MTTLLCPACLREDRRSRALPLELPLAPPDPTYRCAEGHEFNEPYIESPDIEGARRERLREVMPHPVEQSGREE